MYDRKVGYSFTKRIANSGLLQLLMHNRSIRQCPHRTIHIELTVCANGDEDADMNSFWYALRTLAARETTQSLL